MAVKGVDADVRTDVSSVAAGDADWSPGPACGALALVAAAIDGLLAVDLTVPGTGETLDLLRGVERQARRLHGASALLVGQIESRGLAAPAGHSSTAALLRQVVTISQGDSFQRVRLAEAVCPSIGLSGAVIEPRLPLVAAAVANGGLGAKQADVIVRTLTGFPASVPEDIRESVEQFLVEQGQVLAPRTFENVAREIAFMADPDGTDEERNAHEKMEFHFGRRRPNGLTKVWGLLDDLTVEALRAAFGALGAPSGQRSPWDPPDAQEQPEQPGTRAEADDASGDDADAGRTDEPGNRCADEPSDPDDEPSDPDIDVDTAVGLAPDGVQDELEVPSGAVATDRVTDGADSAEMSEAQPWRPTRPPYEWAPLGTVPADYSTPGRESGEPRLFPAHPPPAASPEDRVAMDADVPAERRTAGTRRAQALAIMANKFLELGCAPMQGGERPHLLVTIDEQSLRDRTGSGRLGYGDRIPVDQVRMLACDAQVVPAVLGGKTELLDMGRAMRSFNASCRRAILLRDVGCVFPGCHMPGKWAEFHHIKHWSDGGPSDYSNGCLLCRRHHVLIHQGQWLVRLAADGLSEVVPPITHDLEQRPVRNTLHRPPKFSWVN